MFEDKVITFYQGILRLPPAHSLTASPNGALLRSYWSLDPSHTVRLSTDEEYAEAFREIFNEAVRCRLRTGYRVGSMLSGGLDSSSITCVARILLAQSAVQPLHTFSAIFDDLPQCDERSFIKAVLDQGGLVPHYLHADRISPLVDLDRVLWHEDEAFYAPNLFIHWGLYRTAQQQGLRVLLDGIDGDTAVSHGIVYLTELARAGRWITLTDEVRSLARHFNYSPWRLLWGYAVKPFAPKPIRWAWRQLHGRNGRPWGAHTAINPDFARRIALKERMQFLEGARLHLCRTAREQHCRDLAQGITSFALEVADKAAAAFAVEPRYPFFDRRLAEFCLALPAEQKMSQGWTRMVMRRAMRDILPIEVQWRGGKADLSPNFRRALLIFEQECLEKTLEDGKVIEDYVDMDALRQAYQRYTVRKTNDDALLVWNAVTLALWLRRTGLSHM